MSSTIQLDGRRFPIVALICPPSEPPREVENRWQRSLGVPPHDGVGFYVPAENGVLFNLERNRRPDVDVGYWDLRLYSRACCSYEELNGTPSSFWLPIPVYLVGRELIAVSGIQRLRGGVHEWTGCDTDWVGETIERLSRLPFTEPEGPHCDFDDPTRVEVTP